MRVYILIFANILDPTCSWDRGIWLLLIKFNFGLIRWPPQPPREKMTKIYKIEDFWWSIPHWETRIGHFGARVDGNIKLSICFLWNEAVEFIEATEAVEVIEAAEILRPGKLLLRTLESSRFLNLALFWCFENHFFSGKSWNIIFQFLHIFCWRLLRPA